MAATRPGSYRQIAKRVYNGTDCYRQNFSFSLLHPIKGKAMVNPCGVTGGASARPPRRQIKIVFKMMEKTKTLIVEDDFTSRMLMQELLKKFGTTHVAVNGREAVDAVSHAMDQGDPYTLICLDIMMPEMDGQDALRNIRALEKKRGITSSDGVKIVMTTALDDMKSVSAAYFGLCDGYLTKPITKPKLLEELRKQGVTL